MAEELDEQLERLDRLSAEDNAETLAAALQSRAAENPATAGPKIWLRVVKSPREGPSKYAGRSAVQRVDVVCDGEVVGMLGAVTDLSVSNSLHDLSLLHLSVAHFEEVVEEPDRS